MTEALIVPAIVPEIFTALNCHCDILHCTLQPLVLQDFGEVVELMAGTEGERGGRDLKKATISVYIYI